MYKLGKLDPKNAPSIRLDAILKKGNNILDT
jgi:hypothetical protein